jgi:hypothetical protein
MKKIAAILAGLAIVGTACGSSTEKAAEALKSQTPEANAAIGDTGRTPTVAATTSETRTTTATPTTAPTATRTPTPSPTPAQQALKLGERGWATERDFFTYVFIVENPNQGFSVESTSYQVALYDAAGTVLKADSGSISIMLPGQRIGVAGETIIPSGSKVERVDIQLKTGRFKAAEPQPTFTAENVVYRPDRFSNRVTGVVKSPYQKDLKYVEAVVVAYDTAGVIIGGGRTYIDFVPANGQAAAEVPVRTVGTPAKVEMYPLLTSLSLLD